MAAALYIEDLSKTYRVGFQSRPIRAVKNLFLQVPEGSVCGLLGPNGAGKTTTLKAVLGFIRPDHGRIRIFDQDHYQRGVRKRIGFLPEQPYFYPYFTAWKALDFFGALHGLNKRKRRSKAEELLKLVGLEETKNLTLNKFSKGMLQRLGIAQALINDPDLLILDEPASGLDPVGQIDIRNIILNLNKKGKTILLSSHLLTETERVCDYLTIIDRGRHLLSGSRKELIEETDNSIIILEAPVSKKLHEKLVKLAQSVEEQDTYFSATIPRKALNEAISLVKQHKAQILEVRPARKSLEDLFLETVRGESIGR
jgi:ABC-2 type transport system ATP-binding protein